MEFAEADYIVSRIISGILLVKIQDIARKKYQFILHPFDKHIRYLANELYRDVYEEAIDNEMFTNGQLQDFLLENDLWLPEDEARIKSLTDDIAELKVRMFEASFKADALKSAKIVLKHAKADLSKLMERKTAYNHLSAEGFAEMEKNKFLLGMSLRTLAGKPLLNQKSYWKFPAYILEQVVSYYRKSRMSEDQCRWIARNEPWRSYWTAKKAEASVLGVSPADMTDEQRALIAWSSIYDNVYEHPECPPSEIIEDDDVLDGWFIVQKRKRDKENNAKEVDRLIGNEKIKNAGEVFIPVTEMSIDKIASLNDTQAQILKKQKLNYVDKHGDESIPEKDMPDSKLEIRMQKARLYKENIKGGNV